MVCMPSHFLYLFTVAHSCCAVLKNTRCALDVPKKNMMPTRIIKKCAGKLSDFSCSAVFPVCLAGALLWCFGVKWLCSDMRIQDTSDKGSCGV